MNYKQLIPYDDKVALYSNANIPSINKVQDTDMNNIKNVVNGVINGTNVMGNIVVDSIRSKNMFNTALVNEKNNIIVSGNIIYSSGLAGTAWTYANSNYYINLKAGTYKLSVFIDTTETSQYSGIKVLDNNNVVIASKENIGGTDVILTFTLNNDTNLGVMFKLDTGKIKVQLEEGNTSTPYTPYQNLDGQENYSEQEQMIGYWKDGRPVYKKTITYTGTMSASTQVPHGISNFDKLLDYSGYQISAGTSKPLPTLYIPNVANYGVSLYLASSTNLEFSLGTWAISNVTELCATIIYLKTS